MIYPVDLGVAPNEAAHASTGNLGREMPWKCCRRCNIYFRLKSGVQVYCSDTCKRNSRIETRYGMESGEWEARFIAQEGKCAICGSHGRGFIRGEKPLVVDHDHKTGKVRGLLCGDCNTALGRFGDDPEQLRRAIAYLVAP